MIVIRSTSDRLKPLFQSSQKLVCSQKNWFAADFNLIKNNLELANKHLVFEWKNILKIQLFMDGYHQMLTVLNIL